MLIETLHSIELLKKGNFFLRSGKPCNKIGRLQKGVMRGFVFDDDGNEITTHFYQENNVIVASYIPNVSTTINIQALTACEIYTADYSQVMSYVNKDADITKIITEEFEKLNVQLQSRLVSLLNLDSQKKYDIFLKEYPNLINRIPNYYIANFLGVTPTQLSRVRKQFINKCK